jgi:pilus assembly protein CpaE
MTTQNDSQIAERVMGTSSKEMPNQAEGKKSMLGGFDLKSMLAKKPKNEPEAAD